MKILEAAREEAKKEVFAEASEEVGDQQTDPPTGQRPESDRKEGGGGRQISTAPR